MEEIHNFSWKACKWIECHSEQIGGHIHQAFCGYGGERCVVINEKEILVDGCDPETSTVYQFYGCKWHGCPCITGSNDKYQKTPNLEKQIRSLGITLFQLGNVKIQRFQIDTSRKNSFPILTT